MMHRFLFSIWLLLCFCQLQAQQLTPHAGITSNNTKWTDNNGNPGAQWGAHFGLDVIPVPRATLNLPAGIRLKPGFGVEYSERTLTYANAPNSWKKMSSNGFGASPFVLLRKPMIATRRHRWGLSLQGGPSWQWPIQRANSDYSNPSPHFGWRVGAFVDWERPRPRFRRAPLFMRRLGFNPGYRLGFHYHINTNGPSAQSGNSTYNGWCIQIGLQFGRSRPKPQHVTRKPAVYFYPSEETDITLRVKPKGNMTFTYPSFEKEISFTADSSGHINYEGKNYDYIFWEGEAPYSAKQLMARPGTMVRKSDYLAFLEESLSNIGLSDKEKNDFIVYWMPELQKHDNCFISFMIGDECDQRARVDIQPTPENFLRVYMVFMSLEEGSGFSPNPQTFSPVDRNGFTAVEWGGFEVPPPSN